jgi:oligoendopeptidase F
MFSARSFAHSIAEAPAAKTAERLPEWNLADLYPGIDSPQVASDLGKAAQEVAQFGKDYRGRLESLAKGPDASVKLGEAVARYEALQDLLGRLMSFAGLLYSGDTTDPARAKFYGDVQEKVTNASAQLLFFQLELNRMDDAALMAAASE